MIKTVYKRDGRKQKYDREKLKTSILRAFKSVDGEISSYAVDKANKAVEYIDKNYTGPIQTDELGKIVAHHLMSLKNKLSLLLSTLISNWLSNSFISSCFSIYIKTP